MDIDFLRAIGGVGFSKYCMAKRLISSSPSSSPPSSILEISTKFHRLFLVFLGFLFILVALVNSAADPSKPSSSNMASTATLFSDSSSAAKTNDFRPKKREKGENRKSKRREFEAGDHEVPSGPNPISNR